MNLKSKTLIIAGGGSGGHVFAGIAIADAWKKAALGEVTFVGARRGIEETLVPRAGYRLLVLRLGSLVDVGLVKKIKTSIKLPFAFLKSAWILLSKRPDFVIGVGGYASGPFILTARLMGWMWGVRVAILEQNAVPGFTNRILGCFSHQIFTAFPGVEKEFPHGKVILTGNPVRSSLKKLPSRAHAKPFTVFIFGGSQGAIGVNTLVLDALPFLKDLHSELQFIHQTGEKDFERISKAYGAFGFHTYRVEKFIHDMVQAYSEASLLICRSGSSTLFEIAAVGRAAIFVPLPYHTDQQQLKNAQIFEKARAGLILEQLKSSGLDLAQLIQDLYSTPQRIEEIEKNVTAFYRPDAAQMMVSEMTRLST